MRTCATFATAALLFSVGCATAQSTLHVGIVTAPISLSGDGQRGVDKLIEEYQAIEAGGMIRHLALPDDFLSQRETVVSSLVSLADDPLMKAVVVIPAVPGTAEAFSRIHEQRPGILLIADESYEDPRTIEAVAGLVTQNDYVLEGYTFVWAARQLGARTLVHVSFPRHLSIDSIARRRTVMVAAALDLGLKFVDETADDPKAVGGTEGARQSIRQKLPEWIRKYGKETAFFCTNDIHTETLFQELPSRGGLIVETEVISIPGAVGVDLKTESGDFASILKKVEATVAEKAKQGDYGAYSRGEVVTAGLGAFAIEVASGKVEKNSIPGLVAALDKYTPWKVPPGVRANGGTGTANHLLVSLKTQVLGKNGQLLTPPPVPEKYYSVGRR